MWRTVRAGVLTGVFAMAGGLASADTLQQVYELARQNDALLKAQSAQAAAGRETANIYRSALLPQASLNGSAVETENDLRGTKCITRGGHCDNVNTDVETGSLDVAQNLVNVEAWYDYQQGKKLSERSDAQYRSDELELLVRVTEAYVGVLRAIDTYQTALAQEKAIARQLEQTKQRFDVGLIAITDVQESQATFDSAHVQTLNALGFIGIAFEAVEVLTGQPLETIAPLSDQLPVKMPEPAAQAEWERLALENNPDVAVSALSAEAARANAQARRAAHLPTLVGTFQHSDSDSSTHYHPVNIHDDSNGDMVALHLNVPLFSGGGISAQRRQAYEQQMAAEDMYTFSRRNAVQRARSYHLAVATDIQRVAAEQQAIISAQSALDATQAGYEVGTRNIVDVLDAEQRLYRAKLNHANARYQYILNMLRLLQTAGTLSPENLQRLNQWLEPARSFSRAQYQ